MKNVIIMIALLIAPVCACAQKGVDTAMLVIHNGIACELDSGFLKKNPGIITRATGSILVGRTLTDGEGNLYIAGSIRGIVYLADTLMRATDEENYDFFVMKYARNGRRIWFQTQRNHSNENVLDMTVDKIGNVYVVGVFDSVCTFYRERFAALGTFDAIMFKYDPYGRHVRTLRLAGGAAATADACSIGIDSLGYVYVLGSFSGTVHTFDTTLISRGALDLYLIKMHPNGVFVWVRQYGTERNETACRLAIGTRSDNWRCIALVWSNGIWGDKRQEFVWYDERGKLLSRKPIPLAQ